MGTSWSVCVDPSLVFPSGDQLSLLVDDGTLVFSANEICRILCGRCVSGNDFIGQDPVSRALVDYWLEWEGRELKVIHEAGPIEIVSLSKMMISLHLVWSDKF